MLPKGGRRRANDPVTLERIEFYDRLLAPLPCRRHQAHVVQDIGYTQDDRNLKLFRIRKSLLRKIICFGNGSRLQPQSTVDQKVGAHVDAALRMLDIAVVEQDQDQPARQPTKRAPRKASAASFNPTFLNETTARSPAMEHPQAKANAFFSSQEVYGELRAACSSFA